MKAPFKTPVKYSRGWITDADGTFIADVVTEDADFIATAINSHAEIVAAIEEYRQALDNRKHGGVAAHEALSRIEAALDLPSPKEKAK